MPISLPPGSDDPSVAFGGFTADGEMLTTTIERREMSNGDHLAVREDLVVWDQDQQAPTTVVSLRADAGKVLPDQIFAPTGNARWIVWLQTDFTLDEADWTIWAYDRESGDVRKLGAFDRGPDGRGAPGWAQPIRILGDEATWSAPVWASAGKIEPRIYVADLLQGTVRRLSRNAQYPALTANGQVTAPVAAHHDAKGNVLARPAVFDLATNDVALVSGFDPALVAAFDAGPAGMIEVRILTSATADHPFADADVELKLADGTMRTFPLEHGWGDVAVGDNVIAWQDELNVWALASGQETPVLIAKSSRLNDYELASFGGPILWTSWQGETKPSRLWR